MTATTGFTSPKSPAAVGAVQEPHLRRGAVGFVGLLAQSVAGIGPSTGVALILSFVVSTAGNGAWLVWVISMLVLVCVAVSISQFVKRYATSGGLYVLNAQAHRGLGLVTAWAAVLFSVGSAPILPLSFGLFLSDYLAQIGLPSGSFVVWISACVCTAVAAWLTLRDVALSAIAMLVIEILSVAGMLVLLAVVAVANAGALFDPAQLSLEGVSVHQIAQGVAFTLLAFAAFESSVFLGKEAKHPLQEMSRAITLSVVICGVLFILFTYIMTIGFRSLSPSLAESTNPLHDAAQAYGVGYLIHFIQPGVIIALFGVTIANLNFTSRLLMTLSSERLLPSTFRYISPVHQTPRNGILFVAGFDIALLTLLALTGRADFDSYGFLGGLAGYWVGMTYVVSCIAMMVFLYRIGQLTPGYAVVGAFATLAFLYFFWTSSVPFPSWPGNITLVIFFGSVVLSALHFLYLRARRSPALERLGASASESE